ncbi:cadmium resistance transporter [Kovacikia minuta]|uniref:cadmium resistance transporter n=1 Tax=Kovacikia minuta TaxID=2931930 RepID=UPI0028F417EC|nr:cadmium resistance transporter [Kovacikia minuta]
MANGGDNIGIYIPLFANSSLRELIVILGVFLIMIGIWCAIADQLTQHPLLSQALTCYGHRLVPFILIGLGIFIFIDSGTYQRLMNHHAYRSNWTKIHIQPNQIEPY